MDRRKFLAMTTMGLLPMVIYPKAYHKAEEKNSEGALWREILKHAIMCPSVHNIQPWRVKIESDTRAVLYFDSSLALTYADRSSAFMTVTMAMFAEMISLVASHYGCETQVSFETLEMLRSNTGLIAFARLELVPGCAGAEISLQDIYARRTARFGYTSEPVDPKILASLQHVANAHSLLCGFETDERKVSEIRKLCVETLLEDLYNDAYRDELSQWIRTSGSEKQSGDGLSAVCMGQRDGITHRFFTHPGRFRSGFKKHLVRYNYEQSLHHTHTILWLSHPFETYTDWLTCGKGLLYTWLSLTNSGLYIQPFGNLITNNTAHEKLTPGILQHSEKIWFIARMGYCKMPPASARKSIQTIII